MLLYTNLHIDPLDWDLEWSTLDSKLEDFRKEEIQRIKPNQFDDPSLWLERTRWASYLSGLDRLDLLELIGDPDTTLLRIIWALFDKLAQKSQEALLAIGFFGRFEIVRTEKDQFRAKPFRAYQRSGRISTYSRPWKQILSFFIRTQENPSLGKYPEYHFSELQHFLFLRLIRLASRVENLEDLEEVQEVPPSRISTPSSSQESTSSDDLEDEEEEENTRISIKKPRVIRSLTRLEEALLDFLIITTRSPNN